MASSRNRNMSSLSGKVAELSLAAPQVIAHRVIRMALARPVVSLRDRKEFDLMLAEKQAAFFAA